MSVSSRGATRAEAIGLLGRKTNADGDLIYAKAIKRSALRIAEWRSFFLCTGIMMTPLEAAIAWIRQGLLSRAHSAPDLRGQSSRVGKSWKSTMESASQYFNALSQNIGVLLGDRFGSTDVDCDCPEAIAAARELLPETGLIFGRRSKPFSHYLYRSDPPVRTEQFHDPLDGKTDHRIARSQVRRDGRPPDGSSAEHP